MAGYTARAGVRTDFRSGSAGNYVVVNRKKLDALPAKFRQKVKLAVQKTTSDLHAEVLAIIREKNLIDTGNLLNSVFSYTTLEGLTGYVEVGAFYGIYLEFGTVKMAAKPFLGPAADVIFPVFLANVRAAAKEAIAEL